MGVAVKVRVPGKACRPFGKSESQWRAEEESKVHAGAVAQW